MWLSPISPSISASGNEGRDGVDDDHVQRGGAHELLGDLKGLFAAVGLGDEQVVDVHAQRLRVRGVHGVLGVDVSGGAAELLRLGHDHQGARVVLPRGLGSVNLDDASAREAAHAERQVEGQHAGGNRVDLDLGRAVAQLHHRFLAVSLFDLSHRQFQRLRLARVLVIHMSDFSLLESPHHFGAQGN